MFTSQHKWLYDALLPRSILLYSFGHLWSSSSFHSYLLMSMSQKPHVHFLKIVSQFIHNALFLHNNTFNFLLALSASSTLWQSDAVLHEPCSYRLTCSKPIKCLQNTPIYTAVSRNDFSIVHKVTAWIPYLKTTQPLLGLCDFRNPKWQRQPHWSLALVGVASHPPRIAALPWGHTKLSPSFLPSLSQVPSPSTPVSRDGGCVQIRCSRHSLGC